MIYVYWIKGWIFIGRKKLIQLRSILLTAVLQQYFSFMSLKGTETDNERQTLSQWHENDSEMPSPSDESNHIRIWLTEIQKSDWLVTVF